MKKYYFTVILVLSGVFCGLLQAWINIPMLAYIMYSPMVYALCTAKGMTQLFLRFTKFFFPYYIIQFSFLVTAYHVVPLPKFFGMIIMGIVVILLTLWESLLMFIPIILIRWLKRGKYLDVFSISLLICLGEWLQENIVFLHFPWSAVWLSVTDAPIFMQTANLLGCRVVTFLILTINGFLAMLIMRDTKLFSLAMVVFVQSLVIFYGIYSISHCEKIEEKSEKISVMCAQDDIEGEKKEDISALQSVKNYIGILSKNWQEGTDLVLLPETAVFCDYDKNREEFQILEKFAKEKNCTIVTGCFLNDGKNYNSIYAVAPNGEVSNPYCKQILVPFGEKIPFAFLFGESTLSECRNKDKILPLMTKEVTIGGSICIESIYPEVSRQLAKNGSDLLCISTNDSWFGKSFARQQHYRHSIMRAIENRKYLLRAGNCGISAIISPSGAIISQKFDSTKGVCTGEIYLIKEKSTYTKTGNIFITLPLILTVIAIIKRFTIRV